MDAVQEHEKVMLKYTNQMRLFTIVIATMTAVMLLITIINKSNRVGDHKGCHINKWILVCYLGMIEKNKSLSMEEE